VTAANRKSSLASGVRGDPDRPVVWLAGDLDATSAGQLISAVTKALLDQPKSLVIDMSRLRVLDRLALTSLISVHHQAAAWPGCPLAISGADTPTRGGLRVMGINRYVPMYRDVPEAQRRVSSLPPAPRVREHLPPTTQAIEIARDRVREVCARWRVPNLEQAAQSVVTELVANAVAHTGAGVEVAFTRTRAHLHIAVRDHSREPPRRLIGDESGGYGLKLVEAFATTWGHNPTAGGKIVWAAIRIR